MRGTLLRAHRLWLPGRFIPACAGNTPAQPVQSAHWSVHPRVCGEHSGLCVRMSHSSGSSPRVRGTPLNRRWPAWHRRFIPACAGNTYPGFRRSGRDPVHPRVCGEHASPLPNRAIIFGSSPRVRGTRVGDDLPFVVGRFIPACAGNTPSPWCRPAPAPVHPRVCGEHTRLKCRSVMAAGSSPRVRGTRR